MVNHKGKWLITPHHTEAATTYDTWKSCTLNWSAHFLQGKYSLRSRCKQTCKYMGLFKMIVGVLTTCHTQYTWDRRICIFLFNRTTLQVLVAYLTGALYGNPLWFYKHQHDNRVRSKLYIARQRWWFQWRFWFVPSVPGYLREEEEYKPDPWRNWLTFMKCKHTKRLLTTVRRHLSKLCSKRRKA